MKQSLGPAITLLTLWFATACAPGAVGPTPGAPPQPGPDPSSAVARPAAGRPVEADVRFVAQMIPHHAQALEMVRLVPSRSAREDVRLLAERIGVSQQDEISMMQRWLRDRGQPVPTGDAHHAHAEGGGPHAAMRGMLSREEMQRLTDATGEQFDRLFLESMIRHHEGALHMVAELFASPGGGQEVDVFSLASEIDSDQRMEIARMQRMLSAPRRQ